MKEITKEEILKGENVFLKIFFFGIISTLGLLMLLYPLTIREFNLEAILSWLVAWGVGYVTAYYIGVKNLNKICTKVELISSGKYEILEGILIDKYMEAFTEADDFCRLVFKVLSEDVPEQISVKMKEYESVEIGEKYYLVYLPGESCPIRHYLAANYYYKKEDTEYGGEQ